MDGNARSGGLSRLMSETEEVLAALVARSGLVSAIAIVSGRAARPARTPGGGSVGSGSSLRGRDERELRALAKEIKRLISEDKRRGLPL